MKMADKKQVRDWKLQSENILRQNGYPIKIISRKLNTAKTILSLLGILLFFVVILQFYFVKANFLSPVTPQNKTNETSFITIKIIHELSLSPQLQSYIENKTPEIWKEIKKELNK